MKKILAGLFAILLVFGVVGVVGATAINFDLAGGPLSSVNVSESGKGWISAALSSGLDSEIFSLADGVTREIDFFVLTVGGLSLLGTNYTIGATLAFDLPQITSEGSGSGIFWTVFGCLSGGKLLWDPNTLPDTFIIGNDVISIDFEDGCAFGIGDTATVHAYITNDPAPVSEPATMILLGAGLIGLAGFGRKRFITKA